MIPHALTPEQAGRVASLRDFAEWAGLTGLRACLSCAVRAHAEGDRIGLAHHLLCAEMCADGAYDALWATMRFEAARCFYGISVEVHKMATARGAA